MAIDGVEDLNIRQAKWVAKADFSSVDVLLDLLLHDRNHPDYRFWPIPAAELLSEWMKKEPGRLIPKLGPLLTDEQLRKVVLEAFCASESDERLPWLRPLVPQVDRLSEMELVYLINALGQGPSAEGYFLLQQIRDATPKDNFTIQNEIAGFLSRGT